MNRALSDLNPPRKHPWLMIVAILMLIAGLIIGGLALASAAGIWVGLWDFRRGFSLLGLANGQGYYVMIAGVIVTVGVLALGKVLGIAKLGKAVGFAAIGTICAALGYYVPESYRPPEGTPPIHDISTDTTNPPEYVAVLALRTDAPNTVVYGGSDDMTPERLAELTREAYPDLATVSLAESPDAVFTRALVAVEALGWELVDENRTQGRIEATDTTFWFRFKDDIVIRIQPAGQGSIVDARSLSRVGRGDAGTNARRLRAFFAAL